MHEICTVVMGDAVRAEVEDVLASWESNGATLRELSSLRGHADIPAVDPRALALGREVMAEVAAAALCRQRNAGFTPVTACPPYVGELPAPQGVPLHASVTPLSSSASAPGAHAVKPGATVARSVLQRQPEAP
jgi:hypothetical protein